jgi:hypothetical protein
LRHGGFLGQLFCQIEAKFVFEFRAYTAVGRRLRGLRLPALRGIIDLGESWSLVVVVVVMIVVTMPPGPVLFLIVMI